MGAEIDRLEVAVEAQASKANQQLDLLINKLLKVSNTLTGLNINGFSGMAAGVRNLSAAMKTMSGVKAADFTKTAKGIERLGGVNTSNFQNTAQNVRAMADACIALSGVKVPQIDTNNITALATSMGALSKIDGGKFIPVANGVTQITSSIAALGGVNVKETGINNTINALKRLVDTKLDGFDPAIFSQITQSIAALGGVPDVSRNLNQFISSLSRLAAAGPATQQTANALPVLAANLRSAIQSVSGAGNISDSVNMFVQSVGRLANAGNKTGQTAAQLDVLAKETLKFFQTMTQAPHISRNTIAMTQALAQLASAGGKVGTATGTVTNAFRRLSGIGKSTLSSVKKVANGIVSSFKKIGNSSGHINTATFSLRNLFRAMLPLLGIRQLFNWGKQAVKVASDLTEVQNVVDVTFGDMRDKANEFASTALRDFGLSELSAKDISSRFQAMGVAMGIESSAVSRASDFLKEHSALYGKTASSMADMSIELTKLTADMASLYNVDNQKDVADDLAAIFTGQTRPLRKYGLDLTQATLQEWALTHGINANIQSMTQAEKTLLRYQYVMSNTSAAQGDFAATIGTWANQMRILRESVREMSSVIGGVLINTFKPLITWLNAVMLKVTSVVKTIANALGAIFGWTIELTPSQATSDYDDMADGIGSVGDAADAAGGSLGKATEKAKEFQRFLAGFDEIEKIPDESDVASGSGGSGGSGGAGGVGGSADGGDAKLVRREGMLDMFESEIKTLEQLGEYIGQSLIKAMQGIDWDAIYEKARGFGTGLASFLNGLISPELFSETGRLVANSLNTALYALNSFGETFDWTNFGNSIASGINSFFRNFKFDLAADTFDTFVNGIVDTMVAATGKKGIKWNNIATKIRQSVSKALNGIEWEDVYTAASGFGKGLASFLNNLITPGIFSDIGKSVARSLNAALKFLDSFKIDWKGFGRSIASGVNKFFKDFDFGKLGTTLHDWATGLLDAMIEFMDTVKWDKIGRDIGRFLENLKWGEILSKIGELIWKAINAAIEMWKKSFDESPIETTIVTALLGMKFLGLDAALGKKLWDKIKAALLGGTAAKTASQETAKGLVATLADAMNKVILGASLGEWLAIGAGGLGLAAFNVKAQEYTGDAKAQLQGMVDTAVSFAKKLAETPAIKSVIEKVGSVFDKCLPKHTGQETTPEIEVGISANTNKFDTKVQKSAELLNETLPSETAVDVDASVNVKDIDFKIPKKLRNLPGITAVAENILPGAGATLAGISAVVASVSKAAGINSLKDLGASIMEVWKSGNPILKNVQATVSKTDRQSGSTLTVQDVIADIARFTEKFGINKTFLDFIGNVGTWADKAAGKTFGNFIGNVGTWADKAKGKTFGGFSGNVGTWADKAKGKTFGGFTAQIGTFKDVIKATAKVLLGFVASIAGAVTSGGKKATGGIFVNGNWRPVTAYAGGGAPDMGQMFIAREAGPELVGTIGGHTAVMNNDQIVSSVSDGVYRAVSAAMAQSGGQNGAAPTFNIYIGGRQVTDFVVEDINGRTMATGTCPILT